MPRRRSPASLRRLALSNIASYVDHYCLADPEWSQRNTHQDDFLVVIVPMFLQTLIDELVSSGCLKYHHLMSLMDRRIKMLNLSGALNLMDDADEVDDIVRVISIRCTNLAALSLEDVFNVAPTNLRQLVKSLPLLTHLNLGWTQADDEVVSLVGECCPNIVNLDLRGCPVSDVGVINMCVSNDENVRKCKKLVKKDLTGYNHRTITAAGAEALLSNAPNIQHILGVYELCEAVYNLFCDNEERPVPTDKQLELRSIGYSKNLPSSLLPSYMEVCVAYCPHITELRLGGNSNEATLYQFSSLPLTYLNIHTRENFTFTGGLLPLLERVGRDLLELRPFLNDLDLEVVANLCPKLKVLSVWPGYNVTVHSLPVHSVFSNLETLTLHCPFVTPPVPMEQLSLLQKCPNLQELVVTLLDSHTDELLCAILQLNPLPRLTKLRIHQCGGVSKEGIKRLFQTRNELARIKLQECDITPDGCEELRKYIQEQNLDTTIEASTS